MAYWDVAQLASDQDFAQRCMACWAVETEDDSDAPLPQDWWPLNSWRMAASPGFGDAYASAVAGGVEHPGRDQSVISDDMILAAMQAHDPTQLPASSS